MAMHEVIIVKCDKCGFEDRDPEKFLHVVVSPVTLQGRKQKKPLTERDLCIESCVGLPGVNRDR